MLLLALLACAPGADTAGPIDVGDGCTFVVSTQWTRTADGVYSNVDCFVPIVTESGGYAGYDFSPCCPDPLVVVGVLSVDEVVCGY